MLLTQTEKAAPVVTEAAQFQRRHVRVRSSSNRELLAASELEGVDPRVPLEGTRGLDVLLGIEKGAVVRGID